MANDLKISTTTARTVDCGDDVWFGSIKLNKDQVFATSNLSYALVNLKPIVPGHVLVAPKNKELKRVSDMSQEELCDLWNLAKDVSTILEKEYSAPSFTFAIQDGIYAGQTVDCVHIHIIPRTQNDFTPNDKIYSKLEQNAILREKTKITNQIEDDKRVSRTKEQMINESLKYRNTINMFYQNNCILQSKNKNAQPLPQIGKLSKTPPRFSMPLVPLGIGLLVGGIVGWRLAVSRPKNNN